MDRWYELEDRLERYTDFGPKDRDEIVQQVLRVLQDHINWPECVNVQVEYLVEEAAKDERSVVKDEIRIEIEDAISVLKGMIL